MSAYIVKTTKFRDRAILCEAIAAALAEVAQFFPRDAERLIGATFEEAPEGERLTLIDWHGKPRPQSADLVIRRQYLGPASNDLGYVLDAETGCYTEFVSDYDTKTGITGWIRKAIKEHYAATFAQKRAAKNGHKTRRRRRLEDGRLELVLVGRM